MPAPSLAYRGVEVHEEPRSNPVLTSRNQDTWRTERSGHVVKEHRLPRRANADADCHRNGVTHEVLVDALWELSERDQHAIAFDVPWTGETWFQVKCESVALPGEPKEGGEGDSHSPPIPGPGKETRVRSLK